MSLSHTRASRYALGDLDANNKAIIEDDQGA